MLPRPDDPIAVELEPDPLPVELAADDAGERAVLVAPEPPTRVVAAANAADALGAELERTALEDDDVEVEEDDEPADAVLLSEEARPRSLRLPRSLGAISDA